MSQRQYAVLLVVLPIAVALSACRSTTMSSFEGERGFDFDGATTTWSAPAVPTGSGVAELETPLLVPAQDHPAAQAQTPEPYPNMYRRFELSLGAAVYDNFDTTMQVESDVGVGAIIDLEDLLGVDDNDTVFRADAVYRFSPRHRINFTYYDIGRSGSKAISDDLVIGNVTIPAGSTVDTEFDTTVLKLAYQYSFVADYRTSIGATIGLHTMTLDTNFSSQVGSIEETFKVTAPLPVIGLQAEYALSHTWKLLASAEVFQIELGQFGGFLADNRLSLENNLFKNVGWGIGYNGFTLDAHMDGDDDLTAEVEYGFQGLMIYLRGIF